MPDQNFGNIKYAVIPVAGLGTRLLPATKAIPKEMMPLVDKPLIQYVVTEAVEAGIKNIVLITHSSKMLLRTTSIPHLSWKPLLRKELNVSF